MHMGGHDGCVYATKSGRAGVVRLRLSYLRSCHHVLISHVAMWFPRTCSTYRIEIVNGTRSLGTLPLSGQNSCSTDAEVIKKKMSTS